ncbi:MAG: HIT family protein [Saprospiraceae bacterium]|nr:MAG: histidine triad (HIT) protein [Bacteroidetes bacterium OLB9]MCO6464837.1 HIT family protein [Saprospiraceae bacterium]MCZ2339401.1 HIT family protein [Chitinophagales bacterium]
MASIFTKIVNGEIPAYKIAEDDKFLSFLDVFPIAKGHCLVIPKQEIDYIFDIDDDLLSDLIVFAKKVGIALQKAIPCQRIGMSVVGLEVPHTHIHLIPINAVSDMNFGREKLKFMPEEMEAIAAAIRQQL